MGALELRLYSDLAGFCNSTKGNLYQAKQGNLLCIAQVTSPPPPCMSDFVGAPEPPRHEEEARLRWLADRDILCSSNQDPNFDRLTRLAARVCGTPIALVSLVAKHHQWFKVRKAPGGRAAAPLGFARRHCHGGGCCRQRRPHCLCCALGAIGASPCDPCFRRAHSCAPSHPRPLCVFP